MQALIPLCSRSAGIFRFVPGPRIADASSVSGEHIAIGARSRVDPLALIMAASRGPLREDAVEQVMAVVSRNLVKLNPRANLERYALTAQERSIVQSVEIDPIDFAQVQQQSGAPERVVRRVLYVLRVTHALTLMPLVRRTQSGTVEHAQALPERRPSSRAQRAVSGAVSPGVSSGVSSGHSSPRVRPVSGPLLDAPFARNKPTVVIAAQRPETAKPERPVSGEVPVSKVGAYRSLPPRAPSSPAVRTLSERGAGRYSVAEPDHGTTSAFTRSQRPPSGSPGAYSSTESTRPDRPDPEACFARAEKLMKQREYAAALAAANEALRLGGDQADHEALYAWLLCLQGSDNELRVHPRALSHLDRALRRDPLCERAHHYKGMVLKRLGRPDEAHTHFLYAMQVNRENLEAAREVRLYDMRKRSRGNRPSLVSKLLKRWGDSE
jgi:hypothetical protein